MYFLLPSRGPSSTQRGYDCRSKRICPSRRQEAHTARSCTYHPRLVERTRQRLCLRSRRSLQPSNGVSIWLTTIDAVRVHVQRHNAAGPSTKRRAKLIGCPMARDSREASLSTFFSNRSANLSMIAARLAPAVSRHFGKAALAAETALSMSASEATWTLSVTRDSSLGL